MRCYGCGYDGPQGPKHLTRHWKHQRTMVRTFRAAHGADSTSRHSANGPRACVWAELCREAENVYNELLANVR